ncbi:MAG: arylsulfatase A-like enzyme [Akkermansiaceae bacterium]|jgi:arylsulfatase A-like enzyme
MRHFLLLPFLLTSFPQLASAQTKLEFEDIKKSTKPAPSNIVIIMADDLGFSDLGSYGSEIETPHLDALAQDGLRFSQFYNTAKCHSSRVSLLTGLYCDQAGGESLSRGATIAEVLAPANYHTMMVGKWHLSKQPTDFGFDRYWGHLSGATNFFTGDETFRLDGEKWAVPKNHKGKPFYTTNVITDFAIDFLDDYWASRFGSINGSIPWEESQRKRNQPFLLYCAYNAPHYPLQAPEADVKKYDGKYAEGWDVLRERRHQKQIKSGLLPAKWKFSPRASHIPAWDSLSPEEKQWEEDRMEVYAAMVDVLDQNIGRLIKNLKEKGLYDNTLIMFCSDNGACPFDRTRGKELKPWDPKSYWCYDVGWASLGNTPFRLYKQNQHEGGISSPLIVHGPKHLLKTKPGSTTDQPAHIIDFMATALEVGNASYSKKVSNRIIDPLVGKSLLPILAGEKRPPHDPLYFHFNKDRALRSGDWKIASAKLGRWELYNLAEDRTELHDLAAKHPGRVKTMVAQWHDIAKNKERLPKTQLKPAKKTLAPQSFGKRADPGFKTRKK